MNRYTTIETETLDTLREKAEAHDLFLAALKDWRKEYYAQANVEGSDSDFAKGYSAAMIDLAFFMGDDLATR